MNWTLRIGPGFRWSFQSCGARYGRRVVDLRRRARLRDELEHECFLQLEASQYPEGRHRDLLLRVDEYLSLE